MIFQRINKIIFNKKFTIEALKILIKPTFQQIFVSGPKHIRRGMYACMANTTSLHVCDKNYIPSSDCDKNLHLKLCERQTTHPNLLSCVLVIKTRIPSCVYPRLCVAKTHPLALYQYMAKSTLLGLCGKNLHEPHNSEPQPLKAKHRQRQSAPYRLSFSPYRGAVVI